MFRGVTGGAGLKGNVGAGIEGGKVGVGVGCQVVGVGVDHVVGCCPCHCGGLGCHGRHVVEGV